MFLSLHVTIQQLDLFIEQITYHPHIFDETINHLEWFDVFETSGPINQGFNFTVTSPFTVNDVVTLSFLFLLPWDFSPLKHIERWEISEMSPFNHLRHLKCHHSTTWDIYWTNHNHLHILDGATQHREWYDIFETSRRRWPVYHSRFYLYSYILVHS